MRPATVLVVEDQEVIRDLVRDALEAQGMRVLEAERGDAALRLAASDPAAIDVLLADVVLPGMPGPVVASRLRELRPGVGVVLMSGLGAAELRARGIDPGAHDLLEKPFRTADLVRRVRSALPAAGP